MSGYLFPPFFKIRKGRYPASQTLPRRAIYNKKAPKGRIPLDALQHGYFDCLRNLLILYDWIIAD